MKNIPNLDPLYEEVVAYVKEHQGEKGYIDCQPFMEESGDTIYAIMYDDDEWRGVEYYVYGVRVVDDDLEVLLEPIMNSYRVTYAPDDFTNKDAEDKWFSVRWSDVYYIPTLFNIAECIEEYGE
jgi:hypothetical protein